MWLLTSAWCSRDLIPVRIVEFGCDEVEDDLTDVREGNAGIPAAAIAAAAAAAAGDMSVPRLPSMAASMLGCCRTKMN